MIRYCSPISRPFSALSLCFSTYSYRIVTWGCCAKTCAAQRPYSAVPTVITQYTRLRTPSPPCSGSKPRTTSPTTKRPRLRPRLVEILTSTAAAAPLQSVLTSRLVSDALSGDVVAHNPANNQHHHP